MDNSVIHPIYYMHKTDREALASLKKIPIFPSLLKKYMKIVNESAVQLTNYSSKIHISNKQLPEVYNILNPICLRLGINEPSLFLENNREPNAYTYGDSSTSITITSGLLESMTIDELKVVIAHECGHIACHHVLYHTMGTFILNGGLDLLNNGLVVTKAIETALKISFSYWMRCSEFSADRAASICSGGTNEVVKTMMKLAGGGNEFSYKLSETEFINQANNYKEILKKSNWNKLLQFIALKDLDHPLLAVRASEIMEWWKSNDMSKINKILSGITFCPNCGKETHKNEKFCKNCGRKL